MHIPLAEMTRCLRDGHRAGLQQLAFKSIGCATPWPSMSADEPYSAALLDLSLPAKVLKPVDMVELAALRRALVRRSHGLPRNPFRSKTSIPLRARSIRLESRRVREFDLLHTLISKADRSRKQLERPGTVKQSHATSMQRIESNDYRRRSLQISVWQLAEAAQRYDRQDVGRAGGPDERLGVGVVVGHVQIDRQFQFGHAGKAVASDAVLVDVAEEALDHVQPRCAGGRGVHDEPWVPGQLGLHVGDDVRAVVVRDQVPLQVLGRLALDQARELQPLISSALH